MDRPGSRWRSEAARREWNEAKTGLAAAFRHADRFCARLNAGLTAVALVLAVIVALTAAFHLAEIAKVPDPDGFVISYSET